ncbi:MAG: hypothetical protein ACLQOO_31195 [Terriglobia bacterium]
MLTPNTVKTRSREVGADGSVLADVIYSISQGKRLTSLGPPSGPMIVTTGCSFTFGFGLNDDDSWPWLLQEHLPDHDVVNVAAGGYGTDQALLAAERQVSRSPGPVAAVLLGFADFQIERNRSSQSWLWRIYPAAKPLFVQRGSGVEERGLVKFWSVGSTLDSLADHSVFFSRTMNALSDRILYRVPRYAEGRGLTAALITDFARRFQSRGIPLLVVALPHEWKLGAEADGRFVIHQLLAAGIPTLVPNFPRLPDGRVAPSWFTPEAHPNRHYNLLLADQVAPSFGNTLKLPRRALGPEIQNEGIHAALALSHRALPEVNKSSGSPSGWVAPKSTV